MIIEKTNAEFSDYFRICKMSRVLNSNGRQKRHWVEQAVKKAVTFKAEMRAFMFSLKSFLEFQVEILDN